MDALFNPNNFWNVVLLAGILMTFLSAMPITVPMWRDSKGRPVHLRVPKAKQRTFFFLGVTLILTSLLIVAATNWAGIFSPMKAVSLSGKQVNELDLTPHELVASAYAQIRSPREVAKFRLPQRDTKTLDGVFGDKISVYVGDVHLVKPSHVIVFLNQPGLQPVDSLEYENFKRLLPESSIVLDAKVFDRQTFNFSFNNREYLVACELKWYLVGEDFVDVHIFEL